MKHLHEEGYNTYCLEDIWSASVVPILKKPVIITFDDGLQSFKEEAWPVLQQYDFSATVYLPTGYISDRTQFFQEQPCLTWSEASQLMRTGIRFGSHTVTHPKLVELDWESVTCEIADSKQQIEDRLGERVTSFCYPFAFPSDRVQFCEDLRTRLQAIGYQNAVCTTIGRAKCDDPPFFLNRIPVVWDDNLPMFAAKLDGAYDWLHLPQHWSKVLRPWRIHQLTK